MCNAKKVSKLSVWMESTVIMVIVAVAVVMHCISIRYRWSYPSFLVTEADFGSIHQFLLKIGCISVFAVSLALAICCFRSMRKRTAFLFLPLSVFIWLFMVRTIRSDLLWELQSLMIGGYVIWSYVMATVSRKCFGKTTGTTLYVLFGIITLIFCRYSCIYDDFGMGRPLTVCYMSLLWWIVYLCFFQPCIILKKPKRAAAITGGTLIVSLLFSFERIVDIWMSMKNDPLITGINDNWFTYRRAVWNALLNQDFSCVKGDPRLMTAIQDSDIVWLGMRNENIWQVIMLLAWGIFMFLLIYMLIKRRHMQETDTAQNVLVTGILISNTFGMIAELNQVWGADIGILITRNGYQIVPIICLAILNISSDANIGSLPLNNENKI